MYQNVTGVILSGGKSSRMGRNKSLLKLNNKTIIEIIADKMESLFSKIILSTNTPEEYNFPGIKSVHDIYKNCGPLGGIHASLKESATENIFVISCDVPLMSEEMIEYILNHKTNKPVVLCMDKGKIQPLVGIYSKKNIPVIEDILKHHSDSNEIKDKKLSLNSFIKKCDTEIIETGNLSFYNEKLFFNVNNQDDYEKIITIFSY